MEANSLDAYTEAHTVNGNLRLSTAGGVGKVTGAANVAYAGSLQLLNEKTIAPAFEQATGASYKGQGAGAVGLGKEIASGEITPNVFESIGTAPITALEPKFTSWYVQLGARAATLAAVISVKGE